MVRLFKGDITEEFQGRLDQLDEAEEELRAEQEQIVDRRDSLKEEVGQVILVLLGEEPGPVSETRDRVVIPVKSGRAWDQRVSKHGGGVDVAVLEARLGTAVYRRLLCDKTVAYEINPTKVEQARLAGKLTEEILAAATVKPDRRLSMYRLNAKALKTLEKELANGH